MIGAFGPNLMGTKGSNNCEAWRSPDYFWTRNWHTKLIIHIPCRFSCDRHGVAEVEVASPLIATEPPRHTTTDVKKEKKKEKKKVGN
jgi:hypothetical protein